jgi:MoxR-like ATPase
LKYRPTPLIVPPVPTEMMIASISPAVCCSISAVSPFATTGVEDRVLKTILSADELMIAQRLVRQLPVGDQVVDAILKLVRSARPGTGIDQELDDMIAWGPGPRASQALMLAVRAKAMIEGRLAPSIDDVIELAEPVLKHRMALTFAARAEGMQMSDMVAKLVAPLG